MPSNANRGFVCALLLLIAGTAHAFEKEINEISAELASDIQVAGKRTVAVVDFTDVDGNVTKLGRFLAEEFSAAVIESGVGLEVINRTHLKVIMAENELGGTGVIDPKTAMQLGKITGVQVLITGTVTDLGESVRIVASALDSNTARVIRAARGEIPKTQAIANLLDSQGTRVRRPGASSGRRVIANYDGEKYGGDGVVFVFHGCSRSNSKVTCRFTATNEKVDRVVYTYATDGGNSTILYDDLGNEYIAKEATLGSSLNTRYTTKEMIRNIAIPANFTFEGFANDASYISVIRVKYYTDTYRSFEIRDIEFSE